jgi:hypothetical protein
MSQKVVRLPLTPEGLRDIKENWDLTHDEMARLLGTTGRTIGRYLSGDVEIPPASQMLLLLAEAMPQVAIGLAALSQGKPVDVQGYAPIKKLLTV